MSDANEDILDNDLEPLTPDRDDYDVDAEEAELDQEETNAAIQQKLANIEAEMETLRQLIKLEPQLKNPFIAILGTGGQFQEACLLNNSASTFAGGRSGSVSTLSSGQVLMLEVRDTDAMRFVNPSVGNQTGTEVTVVTSITASGSNATVNSQSLTVLAANATSSSNITFPGSGTNSRAFTGLLYTKTSFTGESLFLGDTVGGLTFTSALAPIPVVDNGSGGTYFPWVVGNVFRVRAGGTGLSTGIDTVLVLGIILNGAGPFSGNQLVGEADILAIPDSNGTGWQWSLDAELTVADASGEEGGPYSVNCMVDATMAGPSLTITGAALPAGIQKFSYCAANRAYGVFPNAPGSITLAATMFSGGGTLILTSLTFELLGPALQTS